MVSERSEIVTEGRTRSVSAVQVLHWLARSRIPRSNLSLLPEPREVPRNLAGLGMKPAPACQGLGLDLPRGQSAHGHQSPWRGLRLRVKTATEPGRPAYLPADGAARFACAPVGASRIATTCPSRHRRHWELPLQSVPLPAGPIHHCLHKFPPTPIWRSSGGHPGLPSPASARLTGVPHIPDVWRIDRCSRSSVRKGGHFAGYLRGNSRPAAGWSPRC